MSPKPTASATVLFASPQHEIAPLIRSRLDSCKAASFVAGYVTEAGIAAISAPLRTDPTKLELLVIGAGNHKAFQACDQLIAAGVRSEHLRVHLGFTQRTPGGFAKYHPMLHSKVCLMEFEDGKACAFIGSHNLTHFAMNGLNGEAGVLLEGPALADEFDAVRCHIAEAARQSAAYDPSMKDAYSWWVVEFLDGLKRNADDRPRGSRGTRTIVALAGRDGQAAPTVGDIIYFEIPDAIRAMGTEVHLYLFNGLPRPPVLTDDLTQEAACALSGAVVGLEDGSGGLELRADWHLPASRQGSMFVPTQGGRFRPMPRDGQQQVRVQLRREIDTGKFVYRPVPQPPSSWVPVLDENEMVGTDHEDGTGFGEPWQLVTDLVPVGVRRTSPSRQSLERMSLESGGHISMMYRRTRPAD